jgi:TonB family protein
LLTNSVVQLAVDSTGEVIAARLEGSCGLSEADAEAVAKARALRFRPLPSAGTKWAKAIFQWQTIEPASAAAPK